MDVQNFLTNRIGAEGLPTLNKEDWKSINAQFTPEEIVSNNSASVSEKMKMQYFYNDRNKDDFYDRVTALIDILEQKQVPVFDARCELCNYSRETSKL